jgi:leucyl aminopeptidase
MKVSVSQIALPDVDADLLAVGLCEGEELPAEVASARGAADASGGFKKLATVHPERPARVLVAGLGKREELDAERLRIVAALVVKEAAKLSASSLAWELPIEEVGEELFEGIVTGTILGSYRFDRFKSGDPDDPKPPSVDSLTLLGYVIPDGAAEAARICAAAQNRAATCRACPPTSPPRPTLPAAPRRSPPPTTRSASRSSAARRSPRRRWAAWSPSARAAARTRA